MRPQCWYIAEGERKAARVGAGGPWVSVQTAPGRHTLLPSGCSRLLLALYTSVFGFPDMPS